MLVNTAVWVYGVMMSVCRVITGLLYSYHASVRANSYAGWATEDLPNAVPETDDYKKLGASRPRGRSGIIRTMSHRTITTWHETTKIQHYTIEFCQLSPVQIPFTKQALKLCRYNVKYAAHSKLMSFCHWKHGPALIFPEVNLATVGPVKRCKRVGCPWHIRVCLSKLCRRPLLAFLPWRMCPSPDICKAWTFLSTVDLNL